MKKYLRLTCGTCKRFTDRLVDTTHFAPDKCTITFKCTGTLFPVEYRSNALITTPPAIGVTDWRARGTSITGTIQDQGVSFIDTSCGSTGQIVLAVRTDVVLSDASKLMLTLNQRSDAPKNYRQYVYRVEGSFTSISGVEAGLEKKTLRFASTDTVEVYLNGVKLEMGTHPENYQVYTGWSAVPPNTIGFNKTISIPGVTQVDVIVSQAVQTTQSELIFKRNISDESRRLSGAWENVDSVLSFSGSSIQHFYLFTLDLADMPSGLKVNTVLSTDGRAVIDGVTEVSTSDIHLLLARKPYSILDRYPNLSITLDTLSFERDYLKYFVVDGATVLYVTSTSVSPIYPLFQVQKFIPEKTIQIALAGVSNQVIVDGSVIVGPDV